MLQYMLLPLLILNARFQIIQRKLVRVVTPSTNLDGNIGPDAVHLLSVIEVFSYLFLSARSFTLVYLLFFCYNLFQLYFFLFFFLFFLPLSCSSFLVIAAISSTCLVFDSILMCYQLYSSTDRR